MAFKRAPCFKEFSRLASRYVHLYRVVQGFGTKHGIAAWEQPFGPCSLSVV